jgi:hypothetical protein
MAGEHLIGKNTGALGIVSELHDVVVFIVAGIKWAWAPPLILRRCSTALKAMANNTL